MHLLVFSARLYLPEPEVHQNGISNSPLRYPSHMEIAHPRKQQPSRKTLLRRQNKYG